MTTIVAISRKAKVPTAGPKIVYHTKDFAVTYVDDVKNICVSDVINKGHPDAAVMNL